MALGPITVGSTLRCLISKAACQKVSKKMAAKCSPVQVGFSIPKATDSAALAARSYVANLQPGQTLLMLDLCNAFNMVHLDEMEAQNFRTNNSIHGRFLFEFVKNNIYLNILLLSQLRYIYSLY